MLLLLLAACGPLTTSDDKILTDDDSGTTPDTDETVDTGPSCVVEPEPPAEKDTGGAPTVARTLTGTVVWTLAFDAAAEAAGYTDCTYTREYEESVEIGDQGWLCPSCSLVTTGNTVMTVGYDDCYTQISDSDAERIEHLGIGDVDGEPHFWRGGVENVALTDQGPLLGDGPYTIGWSDESELDAGGTMSLVATGEFVLGSRDDILLDDVTGARTEPYACGWPTNSPGGDNPSWTVADGAVFPNIRLEDQCEEPVDLWDFRGYYLVIDSSSPNCGPCQAMASTAEAFKAHMAANCAPVELITLLNESLSAVNKPASLDVRLEWAAEFGLTSPVLADKGAGYALMPDYLGVESGMSYPGIVVVDPDGVVLYGNTGFSDWDTIEGIILADWAARSE